MTQPLSIRAACTQPAPISQLMARAIEYPQLVSLAAGFVDAATLPTEPVRAAIDQLAREPSMQSNLLQYGSTHGNLALREQLLKQLHDDEPSSRNVSVDQVFLTAGSNQLLHLISEATLDPGDIVLCAAPTYFVYLGQLQTFGARSIGIECDDEGMSPAALERQIERLKNTGEIKRVKLLYVVSYCDNPCGLTLSNARREALMSVLERAGLLESVYVLDDMAYQQLHLTNQESQRPHSFRHFDPTGGESTILAGTFSKSFAPGVRVGWGILPRSLVDPIHNLKGNIDFGSPSLNQHLMSRVLQLGWFDAQVNQLRQTYRSKLEATLAALEASLASVPGVRWTDPTGGLYVWLTLPESIDAGPGGELLEAAIHAGTLYVPGEYCFPAEGASIKKNTIRLSFGVASPAQIATGVAALAKALKQIMSTTAC